MLLVAIAGLIGIGIYTVARNASATAPVPVSGVQPGTTTPYNAAPYQGAQAVGGPSTSALVGLGASTYTGGVSAAAATGLISKTSSLVSAVPVVGAIVGIGLGIVSAISAHHKAAVAAEASGLNTAIPHTIQGYILIMQGVTSRQLDKGSAFSYVDQMIADYYSMVAGIIKGRWPSVPSATATDAQKPPVSPCNGPCWDGHVIEYFGDRVKAGITDYFNGNHGTVTLFAMPPHAGFNGTGAQSIPY